jgi:hypothetical protein
LLQQLQRPLMWLLFRLSLGGAVLVRGDRGVTPDRRTWRAPALACATADYAGQAVPSVGIAPWMRNRLTVAVTQPERPIAP